MPFEFKFDFFSGLMAVGLIQGLIFLIIIGNKADRNSLSNRYLALFLGSTLLILLDLFLSHTGLMHLTLFFNDFSEFANLLIMPSVYCQIQTKLNGRSPKAFYHFLPAIFYFFYNFSKMIQPLSYKLHNYYEAYYPEKGPLPYETYFHPDYLKISAYINELTLLSLCIYLVLIFMLFKDYRLRRTEPALLKWIRDNVIFVFILIVFFVIVKLSFIHDTGDFILAVLLSTMLMILSSVSGLRKLMENEDAKKYQSSRLSSEMKNTIVSRVRESEADELFFLDPDLSLAKFAEKCKCSTHHLSQVLNDVFQVNFFEYIAHRRMETAKRLLRDPQQFKMDDIANQLGYASKSSFNSAFKKRFDMTPSEYKKNLDANR